MADQPPSLNSSSQGNRKPLRRAATSPDASAPEGKVAASPAKQTKPATNPSAAMVPKVVDEQPANGTQTRGAGQPNGAAKANGSPQAVGRVASASTQAAATAATAAVPGKVAPADKAAVVGKLPTDQSVGVRSELEELAEQGSFMLGLKEFLKQSPAWLASMVVHAALLVLLGLLIIKAEQEAKQELLSEAIDPMQEPVQEVQEVEFDKPEVFDLSQVSESVVTSSDATPLENVQEMSAVVDTSMATQDMQLAEFSDLKANESDLLAEVGSFTGSAVSGRGEPGAKKALLAQYGGNEASERAVAMALEWLAKHQLPDGSWSFDHRLARHPNGLDPGALAEARTAATGMALLPFLGAGMTHKQGQYKQHVYKGLTYLCSQMERNGALNSGGGRMYGHGICSIALCEAYAMTQDKSLRPYAELSLQFIMMAQDRTGGGWRYTPNQAGDTSVVGWQLMALKSGNMAYLKVPPQVIAGVNNFLNTVQADGGAVYGYTGPGRGPATSAVGLLCRMYLGWKHENPALQKGAQILSKMGPSKNNMYFNYYATQVMHHYEGEMWLKWNSVMRDQLIKDQVQDGHEKGSWHYDAGHGASQGGRLYTTALCAMTLEVYYRHLPIHRKQSTADDFLD